MSNSRFTKIEVRIDGANFSNGREVTRGITFKESYSEGNLGLEILVLKEVLSVEVDPAGYVNGTSCQRPIVSVTGEDYSETPYFDSKAKYVLYLYQKENEFHIKEYMRIVLNYDEEQIERVYAENLGKWSDPTRAVMHGFTSENLFLTEDGYASSDPASARRSALYLATKNIITKLINVEIRNFGETNIRASGTLGSTPYSSEGESSMDYLQRPDPNVTGATPSKTTEIDSVFDLSESKAGLFVETLYNMANPPVFTDSEGEKQFIELQTSRALQRLFAQYDISAGHIRLPLMDDILEFLYDIKRYDANIKQGFESTALDVDGSPGGTTLELREIRNKSYLIISIDPQGDPAGLRQLIDFMETFSRPGIEPFYSYKGFTVPSFRPNTVYKSEFFFNKRKIELFIKYAVQEQGDPADLEAGMVDTNMEQSIQDNWALLSDPDAPVTVDMCIEKEVQSAYRDDKAFLKLLTETPDEIRTSLDEMRDEVTRSLVRNVSLIETKQAQEELLHVDSNYDSGGKAFSENEVAGMKLSSQAGADASAGSRSTGQNDMSSPASIDSTQAVHNISSSTSAAEKVASKDPLETDYGELRSDIKDVVKVFKKAQKELDEYAESEDAKAITPEIDLIKEGKNLQDLLSLIDDIADETMNIFGSSENLVKDDLYFTIYTKVDKFTKKLKISRMLVATKKGGKNLISLNPDGAYAKGNSKIKALDPLVGSALWTPSYTVGYMLNLDAIYFEYNKSRVIAGGCFAFLKPAVAVGLVQKYTIPMPFLKAKIGDSDWPAFLGPVKTAAEQAREDFLAYAVALDKAVVDWPSRVGKNFDNMDAIPSFNNFGGEFNKVCNLDKLYQKVLDKLNIGVLLCQVLKCLGLMPVNIPFDLKLILPKIPKLPTFDFLGYLGQIISKAIIRALAQQLCKLVQTILDLLKLDCRGPDIALGDAPDYGSGPLGDFDPGFLQVIKGAADVGLPEPLYSDASNFVSDLSTLLTPSELCTLFRGEQTDTVNKIAMNLLSAAYSPSSEEEDSLSRHLNDRDSIAQFFAKLGLLGAAEFCDTIEDAVREYEFDADEDCRCSDGERLRDKLCLEQGVSGAACEAALTEARRNRERARKAWEDLASGKIVEDMVPELSDFSNPNSPLFDIPDTFKSLLRIAIQGSFESTKFEYYDDIRMYASFLHEVEVQTAVDSQTSMGTNKFLDRGKIEPIETLRTFMYWLSALQPNDFNLNNIRKENIDTLYSMYGILYPMYKERYIAIPRDQRQKPRYLAESIEASRIPEVISHLYRSTPMGQCEVDKVLELCPSPYPVAPDIEDYIIASPGEAMATDSIDNLSQIDFHWDGAARDLAYSATQRMIESLNSMVSLRDRDWSPPAGALQVFEFFDPTTRRFAKLPAQRENTLFKAPIMVGFQPPTLLCNHENEQVTGEGNLSLDVDSPVPQGFSKSFTFQNFADGELDKTESLKIEILKKIADRLKDLVGVIGQNFSNQKTSTSVNSIATETSVLLPKVRNLFQKEAEIIREKTGDILGSGARPLEEVRQEVIEVAHDGTERITLRSPAGLDEFVGFVMASNPEVGTRLYDKIKDRGVWVSIENQRFNNELYHLRESARIHMTFEPTIEEQGYLTISDAKSVRSTVRVLHDPFLLKTPISNRDQLGVSAHFTLENCLGVLDPSLMSELETYMRTVTQMNPGEHMLSRGSTSKKIYASTLIHNTKGMFDKYKLDTADLSLVYPARFLGGLSSANQAAILERSYEELLEQTFEETFDHIYDSPFMQSPGYIDAIEKKLTGAPYYVKSGPDGCPVDNLKYKPVNILIDWDVEIDNALSKVIKRMRKPDAFKNIDFASPSPFEEGIRDVLMVLLIKVMVYEFALRAGPAMSAFKAAEVLNHEYVIQFITKWILDYEIENLTIFKQNPELKQRFKNIITKTTGKESPEEGLREMLLEDMDVVSERIDYLFDSFIEDSQLAFLNRLPYGNVFSVSSIEDKSILKSGPRKEFLMSLSAGKRKFNITSLDASYMNDEYSTVSSLGNSLDAQMSALASGEPNLIRNFGLRSTEDILGDYRRKGGFLIESYVRLSGPVAKEMQKFFIQFETLQEELNELDDRMDAENPEMTIERMLRTGRDRLNMDRADIDDDDPRLVEDIVVSIDEFDQYLRGSILDPINAALSDELEELGYADECNFKPMFFKNYPAKFVSIDRLHTVIDSRCINPFELEDEFQISSWSTVRNLDQTSQNNAPSMYMGYQYSQNLNMLNRTEPSERGNLRTPASNSKYPSLPVTYGFEPDRVKHYILPESFCAIVNSREKEQIAIEAVRTGLALDSGPSLTNTSAWNVYQTDKQAKSHWNKLIPSYSNYNTDFDLLNRRVLEYDVVHETPPSSTQGSFSRVYTFNKAPGSRLEELRAVESQQNPSKEAFPGLTSVLELSEPGNFPNFDLEDYHRSIAESYNENTQTPTTLESDDVEVPIMENIKESLQITMHKPVAFLHSREEVQNAKKFLKISENYGAPEVNWLNENNYQVTEREFGLVLGRTSETNSYERWTQYVIDVVGFAAPVVEVGETFHHPSDLPVLDSALQEVVKTADSYQYWKRYLSTTDDSLFNNNAWIYSTRQMTPRKPGAIICEGVGQNPVPLGRPNSYVCADSFVSKDLNPIRHLNKIYSSPKFREKFNSLFYWPENVFEKPEPQLNYGSNITDNYVFGNGTPMGSHNNYDGADSLGQDGFARTSEWWNSQPLDDAYRQFGVMNHPTYESCVTGFLNGGSDKPRNWFRTTADNVSRNIDSPQLAFYMSVFDKQDDGSIRMSRPLGLIPDQIDGESGEETIRTAEDPWFELRAYSNDIHINHKWTYWHADVHAKSGGERANGTSDGAYSFADCHMFNSALKVIYQDEKSMIRQQAKLWTGRQNAPVLGRDFSKTVRDDRSNASAQANRIKTDHPYIISQYENRVDSTYGGLRYPHTKKLPNGDVGSSRNAALETALDKQGNQYPGFDAELVDYLNQGASRIYDTAYATKEPWIPERMHHHKSIFMLRSINRLGMASRLGHIPRVRYIYGTKKTNLGLYGDGSRDVLGTAEERYLHPENYSDPNYPTRKWFGAIPGDIPNALEQYYNHRRGSNLYSNDIVRAMVARHYRNSNTYGLNQTEIMPEDANVMHYAHLRSWLAKNTKYRSSAFETSWDFGARQTFDMGRLYCSLSSTEVKQKVKDIHEQFHLYRRGRGRVALPSVESWTMAKADRNHDARALSKVFDWNFQIGPQHQPLYFPNQKLISCANPQYATVQYNLPFSLTAHGAENYTNGKAHLIRNNYVESLSVEGEVMARKQLDFYQMALTNERGQDHPPRVTAEHRAAGISDPLIYHSDGGDANPMYTTNLGYDPGAEDNLVDVAKMVSERIAAGGQLGPAGFHRTDPFEGEGESADLQPWIYTPPKAAEAVAHIVPVAYRRQGTVPYIPVQRWGWGTWVDDRIPGQVSPRSLNNGSTSDLDHCRSNMYWLAMYRPSFWSNSWWASGLTSHGRYGVEDADGNVENRKMYDNAQWHTQQVDDKNSVNWLTRTHRFAVRNRLPSLHYFQKNLTRNHYHSPNEVRVPLRMFITRVDYMANEEAVTSKVFFAYDIPVSLKGAETEIKDGKIQPKPNLSRKYFLQKGLEKTCYEYLDYARLERSAMQSPGNGAHTYGNQYFNYFADHNKHPISFQKPIAIAAGGLPNFHRHRNDPSAISRFGVSQSEVLRLVRAGDFAGLKGSGNRFDVDEYTGAGYHGSHPYKNERLMPTRLANALNSFTHRHTGEWLLEEQIAQSGLSWARNCVFHGRNTLTPHTLADGAFGFRVDQEVDASRAIWWQAYAKGGTEGIQGRMILARRITNGGKIGAGIPSRKIHQRANPRWLFTDWVTCAHGDVHYNIGPKSRWDNYGFQRFVTTSRFAQNMANISVAQNGIAGLAGATYDGEPFQYASIYKHGYARFHRPSATNIGANANDQTRTAANIYLREPDVLGHGNIHTDLDHIRHDTTNEAGRDDVMTTFDTVHTNMYTRGRAEFNAGYISNMFQLELMDYNTAPGFTDGYHAPNDNVDLNTKRNSAYYTFRQLTVANTGLHFRRQLWAFQDWNFSQEDLLGASDISRGDDVTNLSGDEWVSFTHHESRYSAQATTDRLREYRDWLFSEGLVRYEYVYQDSGERVNARSFTTNTADPPVSTEFMFLNIQRQTAGNFEQQYRSRGINLPVNEALKRILWRYQVPDRSVMTLQDASGDRFQGTAGGRQPLDYRRAGSNLKFISPYEGWAFALRYEYLFSAFGINIYSSHPNCTRQHKYFEGIQWTWDTGGESGFQNYEKSGFTTHPAWSQNGGCSWSSHAQVRWWANDVKYEFFGTRVSNDDTQFNYDGYENSAISQLRWDGYLSGWYRRSDFGDGRPHDWNHDTLGTYTSYEYNRKSKYKHLVWPSLWPEANETSDFEWHFGAEGSSYGMLNKYYLNGSLFYSVMRSKRDSWQNFLSTSEGMSTWLESKLPENAPDNPEVRHLSSNPTTARSNELRMRGYVEPHMSFCGHSNIMNLQFIEPQLNIESFTYTGTDGDLEEDPHHYKHGQKLSEKYESNYYRWLAPANKKKAQSELAIRRGFTTVAKVYSVAAQEEVSFGRRSSKLFIFGRHNNPWEEATHATDGNYQRQILGLESDMYFSDIFGYKEYQNPEWDGEQYGAIVETSFSLENETINRQFASLNSVELSNEVIWTPAEQEDMGEPMRLLPMTMPSIITQHNRLGPVNGASGATIGPVDLFTNVATPSLGQDPQAWIDNAARGLDSELFLKKYMPDNNPLRRAPDYASHKQQGGPLTLVPLNVFASAAAWNSYSNNERKSRSNSIRRILSTLVSSKLMKKDTFGIWSRMNCPAYTSGENPEVKYLENSELFSQHSETAYVPVQAALYQNSDSKIKVSEIGKNGNSRIGIEQNPSPSLRADDEMASYYGKYRALLYPSKMLSDEYYNFKIPSRFGDLALAPFTRQSRPTWGEPQAKIASATKTLASLAKATLGQQTQNITEALNMQEGLSEQFLETMERVLTDRSLSLPDSAISAFNRLRELSGDSIEDTARRITRLLYGEAGTEPSEIKIGMRLVNILNSNQSTAWLENFLEANGDSPADAINRLEEAHMFERSFYVDLRARHGGNEDDIKAGPVNLHLPIAYSEEIYCFGNEEQIRFFPDDQERIWDFQNFESVYRGMMEITQDFNRMTRNFQNLKESPQYNLLTNFAFPFHDMKALSAIYSSMVLTSMPDMPRLLLPTKNAILQAMNAFDNKKASPGSSVATAPTIPSTAEWSNYLKNVGTSGPVIPCGGVPSFDAQQMYEKIKDLIQQMPAAILTQLAMVLDPGYKSMHQRFRSCTPPSQHIRSLDWRAVQGITEYGWGVPVGDLNTGTLDGNVPDGGKFADVLSTFPADLFMGLTFIPVPPFVIPNPSFGMAFVKMANYILGSLGLGGAFSGGISSPCLSAQVDADASQQLLDGKNGYGHPLLLFGPLALSVNHLGKPYIQPADNDEQQRRLCQVQNVLAESAPGSDIVENKQLGDLCADPDDAEEGE